MFPALGDTLLGRYRVTGELGRGAQGAVLHVWGPGNRAFAAKISGLDPRFQARLRAEANALGRVASEHVVRLVESAVDERWGVVIVTEVVGGVPLVRMKPGPPLWDCGRLVALCSQVAEGLEAIAAAGLVMRDLSPAQVMVAQRGSQLWACLVDLGLARESEQWSDVTGPDEIPGTPGFLAPEWITVGVGDARSDAYSLAALMLWTMRGKGPFGNVVIPELTLGLQASGVAADVDVGPYAALFADAKRMKELLLSTLAQDASRRPSSPRVFSQLFSRHAVG